MREISTPNDSTFPNSDSDSDYDYDLESSISRSPHKETNRIERKDKSRKEPHIDTQDIGIE